MENSMTESFHDSFSQSYSQGIAKITGTKNHIVNFQIPKEVLENRIKTWNNLFDKYSEKMSDDIKLNVETLEPEEEEEEFSAEEYSYGQRAPMRKSATLIQYWVNTGNTAYSTLLEQRESSQSVSSLSEEEIDSPPYSSFSTEVNENDRHNHENDTSFSSVDTAAYILSNTNVTKKADAMAIMEGAKSSGVKSSEDYHSEGCFVDTTTICNDKTKCTKTVADATGNVIHNEDSSDVLHNTSYVTSKENVSLEINQLGTNIILADTTQPDISSQSLPCNTIDETDVKTSKNSNKIENIVSILKNFNELSKRCSVGNKNHDTLDESKVLKEHNIGNEKESASLAEKMISEDINLTPSHRKKLYTSRNSPVDLIVTTTYDTDLKQSRSSNIRLDTSSHPALDSDNLSKKKSLICKSKNRLSSSSDTKTLSSKNVQTKKRMKRKSFSVSNKNIASEKTDVTNDKRIPDSTVDSSKNLSASSNNVDKRDDDNLIRNCNGINMSMGNVVQKHDLTSSNGNQAVLLKQTSLKEFKEKSDENEDISLKNNAHKDSVASTLHAREVENLELTSLNSDQNTILLYKCNNIISQDSLSTGSSLHPKLSSKECSLSTTNAKQIDNEQTNLKNADINQTKKSFVRLKRLPQLVNENYTNTWQICNVNNNLPVYPEKLLLHRSKVDSSNSHGINIKNDVKLREVKVVLQRLPVDFKGSSSATSVSFPADKDKVSQNANINKNKRKSRSKSTIRRSNGKNKRTPARKIHKIDNNYSLVSRIHNKSKKDGDEINNMSDNATKHNNQVSNETKSNFISRYKNHDSRVSQDKHKKFSVLSFISSDEEDLAQLIQPKKRLKTSIDDKASKTHIAKKDLYNEAKLINMNGDKYDSSKKVNVRIYSSKQDNLRKINEWIREENRRDMVKTKAKTSSSDTSSDSSFFSRRNDHNDSSKNKDSSSKKNLNALQNKYLFSSSKNISNDNEKHLNKRINENRINHKNDTCVTLFQTETYNTDFSTDSFDSDRCNNDDKSTRNLSRTTSVYNSMRDNSHIKKEYSNDFYANICTNKLPVYRDEYTKKYNVASKMQNLKEKLTLTTGAAAKTNEPFDKKFNNNINLHTSTTTKTMSYFSVINNAQDSVMQRDDAILNASFQNNNRNKSLQNRQISKKFDLKNLQDNQQHNVTSKATNLIFQTKGYYSDSDSSTSS